MKIINLLLIKFIININFIYFVKSSSLSINNEDLNQEGSGMENNLMLVDNYWKREWKYEQNIIDMENKIKVLAETFHEVEQKMSSIINDNMDLLENNIRKIIDKTMEEKLNKMDNIINEKMDLITKTKTSYNIQELKCSNSRLPKSCNDLNTCNSNIYSIMIPEISPKPFPTVCDLKTLNGGWTVIQRRQDGSENFYRNWNDYVEGFGNLNGEFFIGLEKLHILTTLEEPQELYIILEDFEGERRYARYGEFKVDSNSTDYTLTVGQYTGNADDCFSQHSGHKFTTKDRDNDVSKKNCAEKWKGAWWYTDCFHSNLNGMYLSGKVSNSKEGVSWCGFRKYGYSLKFVQMMIRAKQED